MARTHPPTGTRVASRTRTHRPLQHPLQVLAHRIARPPLRLRRRLQPGHPRRQSAHTVDHVSDPPAIPRRPGFRVRQLPPHQIRPVLQRVEPVLHDVGQRDQPRLIPRNGSCRVLCGIYAGHRRGGGVQERRLRHVREVLLENGLRIVVLASVWRLAISLSLRGRFFDRLHFDIDRLARGAGRSGVVAGVLGRHVGKRQVVSGVYRSINLLFHRWTLGPYLYVFLNSMIPSI
ncbi:Hypothetical protein TPAR_09409 [Tolypocladium paradoxum]|uniref:Uncharacterized protein n=1 Tax=Tolypocladium paradoxum TaxID=94208 RepID=A0A2S4LB46_9HYPO|nr:Hypothetical protein TPAR_09409 [Tolypocladium paradoxum]